MNPAYKPTPFIPSASDSIARRWRDYDALRSGPQILLPANSHHRAFARMPSTQKSPHPKTAASKWTRSDRANKAKEGINAGGMG